MLPQNHSSTPPNLTSISFQHKINVDVVWQDVVRWVSLQYYDVLNLRFPGTCHMGVDWSSPSLPQAWTGIGCGGSFSIVTLFLYLLGCISHRLGGAPGRPGDSFELPAKYDPSSLSFLRICFHCCMDWLSVVNELFLSSPFLSRLSNLYAHVLSRHGERSMTWECTFIAYSRPEERWFAVTFHGGTGMFCPTFCTNVYSYMSPR